MFVATQHLEPEQLLSIGHRLKAGKAAYDFLIPVDVRHSSGLAGPSIHVHLQKRPRNGGMACVLEIAARTFEAIL
jgi:hypothetical protein